MVGAAGEEVVKALLLVPLTTFGAVMLLVAAKKLVGLLQGLRWLDLPNMQALGISPEVPKLLAKLK